MIVFEKIRWKNFLSTGNQFTEMNLNDCSSTLIIGHNGAGKSTILDALCFALFNKPFRKINKPQLVNTINEKDCVVEVEFSIGSVSWLVRRGIKPAKFEIYRSGQLVDQVAANTDQQKWLEQSVLKMNYKSFTQVVILGSSTFVPFMQLPAAHRREVIEDLLDIGIFSTMNVLLKDRIKELQQRQIDCQHMLTLADERVTMQKKNIGNLEQVLDLQIKEKQEKINVNEKKIGDLKVVDEELKTKIENLEPKIVDQEKYTTKVDKLKDMRAKIAQKKSTVSKEIQFFQSNTTCPTCSQTIDGQFKEHRCNDLNDLLATFTNGIGDITKEVDEITAKISEISELSLKLYELKNDSNQTQREIVRLEFENLDLSKQLISAQTEHPDISKEKELLSQYISSKNKTESDCSEVNKQVDEYKVVSLLLKDSGIKSGIIKKYVPIFNKLINKYLQSMDFFVNFTLNEEFEEIIKSRFRDHFSYSSFSEGEKQKIDLALLFTWREVARMKNSVSTNLLILDEVFDSSLDENGTQELMKILRGFGNNTNVLVISHKGEILVDKFMRTAIFEKVNDFSKMRYDG